MGEEPKIMKSSYSFEKMHQLNDEVYDRGISIRIKNPYEITSEKQLNNLETILDKYTSRFNEPAVIAEWGQPFGGPSAGLKVHREREVKELLKAYAEAEAKGVYPKLGTFFDYQWVKKKRSCLDSEPSQFDLNNFFKQVLVEQP